MTDGIDAAVDNVQPVPREPMFDRVTVNPGIEELGTRNNAVLAARKVRNGPVRASTFTLPGYSRVK